MDYFPKCPVCLRPYNNIVIPYTVHPCNHGICKSCLCQLESRQSSRNPMRCPQCREFITKNDPNYDLKELTDVITSDEEADDWVKRVQCYKRNELFTVNESMKKYCKMIMLRISFDDTLDTLSEIEIINWSVSDKFMLKEMKKEWIRIVAVYNPEYEKVIKWLRVLSFPMNVEKYFRTFLRRTYDNMDFLDLTNSAWILDMFVQPV